MSLISDLKKVLLSELLLTNEIIESLETLFFFFKE
jgi:hypothetical protein